MLLSPAELRFVSNRIGVWESGWYPNRMAAGADLHPPAVDGSRLRDKDPVSSLMQPGNVPLADSLAHSRGFSLVWKGHFREK